VDQGRKLELLLSLLWLCLDLRRRWCPSAPIKRRLRGPFGAPDFQWSRPVARSPGQEAPDVGVQTWSVDQTDAFGLPGLKLMDAFNLSLKTEAKQLGLADARRIADSEPLRK
jgi:hypothetical protein